MEQRSIPLNSFPTIRITNEVYLRQADENQDAEAIFNIYHDPLISIYIPDDCLPAGVEDVKRTLRHFNNLYHNNTGIVWIIADIYTNEAIGVIGFQVWDKYHNRIEISYELNSSYWRQGIMYKAVLKVISYAFEIMKVQRVQATTITENIPSIKLLLKAGFTKEGILASYKFYKQNYVDIVMLGLSRLQYMQAKIISKKISRLPLRKSYAAPHDNYKIYHNASENIRPLYSNKN